MRYQIDWHSHILPGIDDGSQNVETSLEMLRCAKAEGADCMIATPHFYANRTTPERFLLKREQARNALVEGLEESLQKNDEVYDHVFPRILCGAEVYWFSGMSNVEDLSVFCIEKTKLMLLEMPFSQWSGFTIREVEGLLHRGITPVIAHLERYQKYQKDSAAWKDLLQLPVEIQLNGECFASYRKRFAMRGFLKSDFPYLLGSDCHNMTDRRPGLSSCRSFISKKYGEETLEELDQYANSLIESNWVG